MATPWEQLRIVLVSPRNPLNIGAAARAMRNFGFPRMRVVNPYELAFREARSAVDASSVLLACEEYRTLDDAVADCSLVVGTTSLGHRALQHSLRRLEYGAREIAHHAASGAAALVFGSEKFGLGNDEMSRCHWLLRIPTVDQDLSMNLGQAVAVCLYELVRDPEAAQREPEPIETASAEESERFTGLLKCALEASGYVNPVTAESADVKLRRLVRRLNMPARDVPTWLGMLRQILWKLRRG